MSTPSATYVGVDVAKDTLAVCSGSTAKTVTVPNTAQSIGRWLAGLPANAHLVCEATGRHHRLLQQLCAQHGRSLSCLNPARARDYAKSLGKLEKTDPIDARMLWQYGEERHPAPTPTPSPVLQRLGDLLMARRAVTEQISAFGLRDDLLSATAQRRLRGVIRALQRHQEALEQEMDAWLSGEGAPWQDKIYTLCLAPGVGVLSALHLVAYLPELGMLNRRQIAKLAGLAPLPFDSGRSQGLRRIQGGRAPVRRVLYMCAMVASRCHAPTREFYRSLRARGKTAPAAYIAVARKLLIYLNSLLRPASAPDHQRA